MLRRFHALVHTTLLPSLLLNKVSASSVFVMRMATLLLVMFVVLLPRLIVLHQLMHGRGRGHRIILLLPIVKHHNYGYGLPNIVLIGVPSFFAFSPIHFSGSHAQSIISALDVILVMMLLIFSTALLLARLVMVSLSSLSMPCSMISGKMRITLSHSSFPLGCVRTISSAPAPSLLQWGLVIRATISLSLV